MSQIETKERLIIGWDEFCDDVDALVLKIKKHERREKTKFMRVTAVTRGGLAASMMMSYALDIYAVDTIAMAMVTATSAAIVKKNDQMRLILDEVADTGATALTMRKYFPGAHLAAVYVKPEGAKAVDFFARLVPQGTWIVFPWDKEARRRT